MWKIGPFNFTDKYKLSIVLSLLLISVAIGSLFIQKVNFGIDFTGGTIVEVYYPKSIDLQVLRNQLLEAGFPSAKVQYFGSINDILIRIPLISGTENLKISEKITEQLVDLGDHAMEIRRIEFVGPEIGDELTESGGFAMLFALACILVYVALRFQIRFSIGAIVALVHDIIITIGFFSVLQLEFNLSVLAALLAVIGYSLNDTIVIFDRVRENFRKLVKSLPAEVINISINETLSRTAITSLTTLLVLFTLLIYGGESVKGFSLALIFGVLIGTYSSIFVASPITLILGISRQDLMPVEKEGAELN